MSNSTAFSVADRLGVAFAGVGGRSRSGLQLPEGREVRLALEHVGRGQSSLGICAPGALGDVEFAGLSSQRLIAA